MFVWLVNHILVYVLVFFWGYFTVKSLFSGFWWFLIGASLCISYYDFARHAGLVADVAYLVGGLDYKFGLRDKAGAYVSYGVQLGLTELQAKLRQKVTYQDDVNEDSHTQQGFDKNWYDEELERERQKAQQAEEKARKANEQAQRAKEEAQREKQKNQNSNNQQKHANQGNKKALDPTKLKDAYEILGVAYGTDKETCKKHFRKLMAMYHPDKLAGFTGYRREQMEQEAKAIGVAWETVQKRG